MFELNGKYNSCKVFTDNTDSETVGQLMTLLNQEFTKDSQIRIMPDTHAGSGCVIGTTMTITDKIVPNLVGVDIGCFRGNTKVYTASNGYVPIKDLVGKDKFIVNSYDTEQNCFVYNNAIAKLTRKNADLIAVTYCVHKFKDKTITIECTPDHKFLVKNKQLEWIEAKNLKPNMTLMSEDWNVTVSSIKNLNIKDDVYCLTVENTHNFLLEGSVVVHNCGMLAVKLEETEINLAKLDEIIHKHVPSGFNIHDHAISRSNADKILAPIDVNKAFKSLGTLGGGNHFIEIDRDANNNLWLVVHTGSRHLGIEVCKYYQDLAYHKIKNDGIKDKINETVARLKAEGKQQEIENAVKMLHAQNPPIPKDLCYVDGQDFKNYMHDMYFAQEHAKINRKTIVGQIVKHMDLHIINQIDTIHNYIDTDNMILRKGSVSAQLNEELIIPMNMRDGSLICIGKGNPDWNYSAPHGAGRIMSRREAKDNISMEEYRDSMSNVYTTCVNASTIDEAPMVYKPMKEIIKNIQATVDIVDVIKPIYNYKAN